MLNRTKILSLFLACMALLQACALTGSQDPADKKQAIQERIDTAKLIIEDKGFTPYEFSNDIFDLFGFLKIEDVSKPLVIYLEGDGFAYATRSRPSNDPTPKNPIALRLAAIDTASNIFWLARPCQYSLEKNKEGLQAGNLPEACETRYWTTARYSREIITAIELSIQDVLNQYDVPAIDLVGFSGGGAVAVLLAKRFSKVQSLRTVAGNIDHVALMRQKKVTPLSGSLDPAKIAPSLKDLPQTHFVGEDDDIVPPWLARRFVDKYTGTRCAKVILIEDAEHQEGWEALWQDAASIIPACKE